MEHSEEYTKAKSQYDNYWEPVSTMFKEATTRAAVKDACNQAQEKTGLKYCYGIGFHGNPSEENEESIEFHGWLYDEEKEMISVWYTHGLTV